MAIEGLSGDDSVTITPAVVDELLSQVARDRDVPYWSDRLDQLDGVESWLSSLRDWLAAGNG